MKGFNLVPCAITRGYHSVCHFLYCDWELQGVMWINMYPRIDFILQSSDTLSLGMSIHITEPPKGLLIHLQLHLLLFIEEGARSNESAICGNKTTYYISGLFKEGCYLMASSCFCDGGKGFMDPGEKGCCMAG